MKIELLHSEGCLGAEPTRSLVEQKLSALAPHERLDVRLIESDDQALAEGFLGSPSVRIDGRDLEQRLDQPTGLT
jgi:hypothetical protein